MAPLDEKEMWERLRAAEVRLEERDRSLLERWQGQQNAIAKATRDLEERLALLNELRDNVLTRGEYDGKHEQLSGEISRLATSIETVRGACMTRQEHGPFEGRLAGLENWRANLLGRLTAFGVVALLLVGTASALIAHLVG